MGFENGWSIERLRKLDSTWRGRRLHVYLNQTSLENSAVYIGRTGLLGGGISPSEFVDKTRDILQGQKKDSVKILQLETILDLVEDQKEGDNEVEELKSKVEDLESKVEQLKNNVNSLKRTISAVKELVIGLKLTKIARIKFKYGGIQEFSYNQRGPYKVFYFGNKDEEGWLKVTDEAIRKIDQIYNKVK